MPLQGASKNKYDILLWYSNLILIGINTYFIFEGMSPRALRFIWKAVLGNIKTVEELKLLMPSVLDFVGTFYFAVMLFIMILSVIFLLWKKTLRIVHLLFNIVILLFIIILQVALQPLPWVKFFGI